MRIASCPRCGKPRPTFDGKTVSCQRCRQATQLSTATPFLEKANALWPDTEVTLRSKRVLSLIEQHDEWLKDLECARAIFASEKNRRPRGRYTSAVCFWDFAAWPPLPELVKRPQY